MWPDKPIHAWNSATGGEHFERLFWDTIKDKSWLELEQHISPDFVYVGPSGIHEKLEALEWFQKLQIKDLTLGEMTVHPNGGDVMVVTYIAHLDATSNGKPLSSKEFRMTSTWQNINKKWLMIARAHTPAVGPNVPN